MCSNWCRVCGEFIDDCICLETIRRIELEYGSMEENEDKEIEDFGLSYDVVLCDNIVDMGHHDLENMTIFISSRLCTDQRNITLLHESIHAILSAAGMHDKKHNEQIIDAIANGVYSMVKNNKDLFRE